MKKVAKVDIHDLLNKISLLFKNKIFVAITIILILVPWILLSLQDDTINNIKENKYSVSNNKISYTDVLTALNNFYSRLKFPDTYIFNTNKFLCTGTNITCMLSNYTNIGLINKDEYNNIQGYLKGSKSYWTMSEEATNVYKITSNGIELESSSNLVALRPSIYLQENLRVMGSGTADDPYILSTIDNTPPLVALTIVNKTTNSITVVATAIDEETSISKYEFKIDDNEYINNNISNTYKFSELITGSHIVYMRVTNGKGMTSETSIEESLIELIVPTYLVNPNGWSKSKTITINYPQREEGYIFSYSKDEGSTWVAVESGITVDVIFNANGNLIGKISDGVNAVTSSQTISQIDNTAPLTTSVTNAVSNISYTNFTITRSGNATDTESGLTTNPYIYQISTNGTTWSTKCTNNITSCEVTNVSMNTLYYYRICAVDNVGNQSCTASKNITTSYLYEDGTGSNSPVLASNMIPIAWNGSAWVKANTTSSWYNYSVQKWANAVVVTSASRSTYLNAAAGTPITESDVLAYYVWIPRYAYKILGGYHLSTVGIIQIEFLNGTKSTKSGVTIGNTPTYSGSVQTNYVVHPAFNFGGTQVTGIWVAKFEMTGSITSACFAESCTTAQITSKPYLTTSVQASVKNQTVASFYYASRSMERSGNQYGFVSSEVDTHMMKNIEWGMVAYLTQSQYGKGTEVWINPSASFYTGCAGDNVSVANVSGCANIYTSNNGQQASTTGNVYGIYDMSGGASEFVMGNYNNTARNSELIPTDIPNKYIDRYGAYGYKMDGNLTYGDATYDTSLSTASPYQNSWNSDYSFEAWNSYPWFIRGGIYGDGATAGLFNFGANTGASLPSASFRTVCIVGLNL